MPHYLLPIIVLALITTLGYFRGRKKNRWIAGWIGKECEKALKPKKTEYVNIGGTIGYNFTYSLMHPLKNAKGTFTLLPRQSVLYFPISLLISRHDRFYLHIYASIRLLGEGHIIKESYLPKMRVKIAGIDSMKRDVMIRSNQRYVILWRQSVLEQPLKRLLNEFSYPEDVLHFCTYKDTKVFFLHMIPRKDHIASHLKAFIKALDSFLSGGSASHEQAKQNES